MTTSVLTNAAMHPVDLASGQVLAPGEQAYGSEDDPHNAALIRAGQLAAAPIVAEPASDRSPGRRPHRDKEASE